MKALVVYHSYTGQTRMIAEKIKEKLNCDILDLKSTVPFSTDYQSVVDEYQSNESDKKIIEIENISIDLKQYDKVIIGSPVWWYTITPVVRSFLTKYNLSNKEIYPFATNAGCLGRTFKEVESICNGNIYEGLNVVFSEDYREKKCITKEDDIVKWIEKIK